MLYQALRRYARPARPSPARKPAPQGSLWARFRNYQKDEKNRKKIAAVAIGFYIIVGLAGVQYLKDTKYKALDAPNPYKKSTTEGGVVEAHDTTPVYNSIAKDYDSKIWLEELTSYIWWMRRRLMKQVSGDALEVSCGTGRNSPWLNDKQVTSLTLLDSSHEMLEVCREKYAKKNPKCKVQYVEGKAEVLDQLASKSGQRFDTVFESFGLCSHEDPGAALKAMGSLLKPGGKIVLLEHGRGPYESMNKTMDEKAAERAKEWGCRWNLDIDKIVRSSGLEVEDSDTYHFGTIYWYVLRNPSQQSDKH